MASESEEKASAAKSVRGPSYPTIALEEAVKRAQQFWDYEKRNAAPVTAAAKHWGYAESSSSWKMLIAALLQFGLLEDAGGSKLQRTVKLTGRALDILLDQPDSINRQRALKDAAASPKIYSDILVKWPAHELPSDQTIRFFLLRDRGFNEAAISSFLKDFRASLSFAKLDIEPTIEAVDPVKTSSNPQEEPGGASVKDADMTTKTIDTQVAQPTKALPLGSGHKQDTFSLDEGQVILQFPEKMSDASYEDFKDWIELQLRKIKRSIH